MFQCSQCGKNFKYRNNVYRHKKESCQHRLLTEYGVKKVPILRILRCKECNIWYIKSKLRHHKNSIIYERTIL